MKKTIKMIIHSTFDELCSISEEERSTLTQRYKTLVLSHVLFKHDIVAIMLQQTHNIMCPKVNEIVITNVNIVYSYQ